MARSQNQNILSGLHAQREGVNASDTVNQRLTPQNIVIFFQQRGTCSCKFEFMYSKALPCYSHIKAA